MFLESEVRGYTTYNSTFMLSWIFQILWIAFEKQFTQILLVRHTSFPTLFNCQQLVLLSACLLLSPVTCPPSLSIHFFYHSLYTSLFFLIIFSTSKPSSCGSILLPFIFNLDIEYITLYWVLHIIWIFHWPIPLDLECFSYLLRSHTECWSYHFLPSFSK